jgi:hypothetical protein
VLAQLSELYRRRRRSLRARPQSDRHRNGIAPRPRAGTLGPRHFPATQPPGSSTSQSCDTPSMYYMFRT